MDKSQSNTASQGEDGAAVMAHIRELALEAIASGHGFTDDEVWADVVAAWCS